MPVAAISAFSVVDIVTEQGTRPSFAAGPVEPDVQSNDRRFDGRIYVTVLDDPHVDGARSVQVKQAARQFIERHLAANDLMAVTFTSRAGSAQCRSGFFPRAVKQRDESGTT